MWYDYRGGWVAFDVALSRLLHQPVDIMRLARLPGESGRAGWVIMMSDVQTKEAALT